MQRLALLLCLLVAAVCGEGQFPVYRMVQYSVGDKTVGPKRANVNLQASVLEQGQVAGRRILVLLWREVRPALLNSSEALLIVLPKEAEAQALPMWRQVESALLHADLSGSSVFFAHESDALLALHASLGAGDEVQLSVKGRSEAPVLAKPSTSSLHGSLGGVAPSAPLLAVFAYYDTLGAAPALARGDGSGLAGLLEVARLFSLLVRPGLAPSHNLLFVVTGGSRLNYRSTWDWASSVDPVLLDRIEMAVCLDDISGSQLYVHYSRGQKSARVRRLLGAFKQSGAQLLHKRINLREPVVRWQHEMLARKNVLAVTVSSESSVPAPPYRSSSLHSIDRAQVLGNAGLVAEALGRLVFPGASGAPIFQGSMAPDSNALGAALDYLASHSRMEPLMDAAVLNPVQRWLNRSLGSEVVRLEHPIKDKVLWHEDTPSTMQFYRVTSYMYNLYVPLSALAYLYGVYQVLSHLTTGRFDPNLKHFN